ncbi:GH92 family glycosyl hydrolase [Pedobacter hartonius]|uniref:Alpha-1,2-mannosidase, putative n=1 Tax=Pedobacter hartonius TaxID=425514 RepID=A0A1H4G5I8_9SPHI|nr:GH92 family glycosyl hydrolase [Pedobacter hartonius]SEB04178.1 alpha-1,2-mannosidase, putative [Pedobacter hartonius]
MTKNRILSLIAGISLISSIPASTISAQTTEKLASLTKYVDPFIGSVGHGHVFVGANVPTGAVQLGPSQIMQSWDEFNGWDWCSGYNYISKEILGFSHTHLSGTGIGDLNDVLIVPANGEVQLTPAKFNNMASGYGSFFSKDSEVAKPGYYSAYLDKYKVKAELTATKRVGFHRYHYEKTDNAHLLLDLDFSMLWDKTVASSITQVNDSTFTGYRYSTGWSKDQRIFFAIVLSVPVTKAQLYVGTNPDSGKEVKGVGTKAALFFDAVKNPDIEVKVGISPVSTENARANIAAEAPKWNFDEVKQAADLSWNKVLNKIVFEADKSTKTVFYTALYHTFFLPTIFNDHNGDYRGTDKKVYTNQKFTNYTTFSLWDTYRALNPLMTVIEPAKVKDMVHSLLAIYQQQGKLPLWPLQGSETFCMVGYPSIAVITDAYLKGLLYPSDVALAYKAIRSTAMKPEMGIQYVKKLTTIPAESLKESVAWAMEYAIADWGISKMAAKLGKKEDALYFGKRARLYEKYYNAKEGHFVGKLANGNWNLPFDPIDAKPGKSDYTEGNGWQYTWLVPQDAPGLIRLNGGDKAFTTKLDHFFTMSSQMKNAPNDVTGLIGQYAHGNEPSHHVAYLYNYAGQPWRTAEVVRDVMNKFYTTEKDGICGNEDAGQMSAWYVLSSMGFYSMNPMSGVYVIGSPVMDKATISVGSKKFTINVENQGRKNIYIQKILMNGKPYTKSYIRHTDLVKGGTMTFYMGNKPSATFGISKVDRPL